MADFPAITDFPPVVIHNHSKICIGPTWSGVSFGSTNTALNMTSANRAIFLPFVLAYPYTAAKMFWINGATVGTNHIDIGIYNSEGNLLVSIGSTLTSGVSVIQSVDITDTSLSPGLYYMAIVMDGTTDTVEGLSSVNNHANLGLTSAGARIMNTAFPLPSTVTLADISANQVIPLMGITSKTIV